MQGDDDDSYRVYGTGEDGEEVKGCGAFFNDDLGYILAPGFSFIFLIFSIFSNSGLYLSEAL